MQGRGQPVTINGVAINETSYIRPGVDPSAFPFSVTVTEGRVFVMGDQSRQFRRLPLSSG